MYTSYFAKSAGVQGAVSIADSKPKFFAGPEYKKLAPKRSFFLKYKQDGDSESYSEQYHKLVLDQLDPAEVVRELGQNAVLLCWENPDKFCHRHIVAAWLYEQLGMEVREIE